MTSQDLDRLASDAIKYIYQIEQHLTIEDSIKLNDRIIQSLSVDKKYKHIILRDTFSHNLMSMGYILLGVAMCTLVIVAFTLLFLWLEWLGG